MFDFLKGSTVSKTMWFAALLAGLSVAESQLGLLTPYMTKENLALLGGSIAVAIAILRSVTTMSLQEKAQVTTTTTTDTTTPTV